MVYNLLQLSIHIQQNPTFRPPLGLPKSSFKRQLLASPTGVQVKHLI